MSEFEQAFKDTVADLETQAKVLGITLEALAVNAGVSSSRLREWKRRTPQTVRLVGAMQEALAARRATVAAGG
jgi:lambda repressor-like predicted transcriptional regulator